ncbi:MAG: hydrogenase formation protein HypD [Proteobacteria bacterium]|nr:hydrogenase formation protein HypD [Pseudomonadota bacterium]
MNIELSKKLLDQLIKLSGSVSDKLDRQITLMEVCGTHTTAISKSGLRGLLSPYMELLSGPGCPVCVTDQTDIDRMLAFARLPGVVIASFGDMIRVPGTHASLEVERARGARIEICYSPHEALSYAVQHIDKEIVFLGVGFETTAPAVALSVMEAKALGIINYSVLSVHKLVPPAMKVLLADPELNVDGFILPGHVSVITGRKVFDFIASEYGIPAVIAGFEPIDIMEAISLLLKQIVDKKAETINGYTRLVSEEGNIRAKNAIEEVFEPEDASWRGFGLIPESGLVFKKAYAGFDAAARFPVEVPYASPPEGCSCGEVLKGKIKPDQCPLFSIVCTPADPTGPCMVSSEGACAAYFNYGDE